ncbi:MAG: hypothetical protein R6V06_07670 [Kiritimatiellia bacterium]
MPFGKAPEDLEQAADPEADKEAARIKMEQQKLARKINMSAVNITPQGEIAIGFTDLSSKPPINYYLVVGDESGGWKLLNADYDKEIAELSKNGINLTLKLGKGLIQQEEQKKKTQTASLPSAAARAKRKTTPGQTPATAVTKTRDSTDSIRDRLKTMQKSNKNIRSYMERLRERKLKEAAARKKAEESQRQQLEKLARDVASKEIKKRAEAIAEEAALEKELALEEERLLKEEAEIKDAEPAM